MTNPTTFRATPELNITVPGDLDSLPVDNWKVSHHASGVMHSNATLSGGKLTEDVFVGNVFSVAGPQLIASFISKPPSEMPRYERSITRGGASAICLEIADENWTRRSYLDFLVTPAGSFRFPPTVLKFHDSTGGSAFAPTTMTFAKDDGTGNADIDLMLAVRHVFLGTEFSAWRPEAGIWLQVIPASSEEPGDEAEVNQ